MVNVFNVTYDKILKDFYGYKKKGEFINANGFFSSIFDDNNDVKGLEQVTNNWGNALY